MKRDLYRTLEVLPTASEEEVKRAYRRLALLYHPDRNRAGMDAEERFKDVNDAYSILGNSEKRKRYDLYRAFMRQSSRWGIPPSPSQEKILEDLLLDPTFPGFGRWLDPILRGSGFGAGERSLRALSKTALRLLRQICEQGRSNRRAGGQRRAFRIVPHPREVFRKATDVLHPFGSAQRRGRAKKKEGADVEWALPVTREEAVQGSRLTLSFLRDSQWDRISVQVPPGTREGVRLRIRNKGNHDPLSGKAGDLYLRIRVR
jgi:curved DNA-binding protein